MLTTAAFCGAASGTLITSIRNCDSSWSKCGVARFVPAGRVLQPASSAAGPDAGRAVDVHVEIRVVVRALQQRVRVRSAARLHGRDLDRSGEVRDVEDADAAEALRVDGAGRTLRTAIDPPARLLDRHEEQVLVDGHLALPARADDRRHDLRVGRIGDVVDLEAVEVSDEGVVALEGEIGVDEREAPGLAGSKNPAGFIRLASSSTPLAATPASAKPGLSAARGSVVDCAAASEVRTAAASSAPSAAIVERRRGGRRKRAATGSLMSLPWSPTGFTTLISRRGSRSNRVWSRRRENPVVAGMRKER